MSYDDDHEPANDIGTFLRNIQEGHESVMDITAEVDPETGVTKNQIAFGKRKLQPEAPDEPDIKRARARDHEFHDIEVFGEYLKSQQEDGIATLVLADVGSRTITAVLDENDASDRETVSFKAKSHPLFDKWGAMLGKAVPVQDFAMFVMQHRSDIVQPEGRELAMIFSQVKASKSVTIHQGQGKKSINGVVVELNIAGERQDAPVELPDDIEVTLPLFLGSDPVPVKIDLLVTELREEIVVFCTAPEVELARIRTFERFVTQLRQATELMVGLGQVKHRDWRLVE